MTAEWTGRSTVVKALAIFAVLFAFAGPGQAALDTEDLVGTWQWVQTVRPWTPGRETPESEGYSQTLHLGRDGTFTFIRDSFPLADGTWSLSDSPPLCGAPPSIRLDHPWFAYGAGQRVHQSDDQLTFGLMCTDLGPDYTFRRVDTVPTEQHSWGPLKARFGPAP